MVTPFEAAALHSYKAMQAFNGRSIVYQRPSLGQSVTITKAVPGRTTHDITQDGMTIEQVKSEDYLVLASELILGGQATLPRKGDKILVEGRTLAVLCVGSEPQYKYWDPNRLVLRIHTKEM